MKKTFVCCAFLNLVLYGYHRGNYPVNTRARHLCAFCTTCMSVPGTYVRSALRWTSTRDVTRVYPCRNIRVLIQVRVPPIIPYIDAFVSPYNTHTFPTRYFREFGNKSIFYPALLRVLLCIHTPYPELWGVQQEN